MVSSPVHGVREGSCPVVSATGAGGSFASACRIAGFPSRSAGHLVPLLPANEHLALVPPFVPRSRDVPAIALRVERSIVPLHDVGVDRLVGQVEQEGMLVLALDEPDRPVGQQVGGVARHFVQGAILEQLRVGGVSLARHRGPVVPAGSGGGVVAHVPLADEAGAIARLLERNVEGLEVVTRQIPRQVVDDAVAGRELAGEQGRPVRGAERHRMERIHEEGALGRQPVHVGRLEIGMAPGMELVEPEVVHQHHDQIGPVPRRGGRPLSGPAPGQKPGEQKQRDEAVSG